MKFVKNDFSGALNMQFDPSRIAANEYALLFNGRCREGVVRPVKAPLLIDNTPVGNYQGIYTAGQYALLLSSGKAYIKDFELGGAFNEVPDLQLDPNVDFIYVEGVPVSTRNFVRVPSSDNKQDPIDLTDALGQSRAGVLLQDSINQPWVIHADGTARVTKSYAEWTLADPEYVPIGRQMLFDSGILYIVSPDGEQIYRMCTDRPLNGMVNITVPNGDKQATEADGGSKTVAHALSSLAITCLAGLNTPDSAFFAATRKLGAMVIPDFVNTLFGEPQFDNVDLFAVGPVNQFSFAETNGDFVFVTSKGIRSFNATLALKNESRNTPFSARIQRAFRGVTQTAPAIGKFDDYVFFSVATVYGNAVVVYDETLSRFVSIDQWANVARVKQFATITTASREVLLFITADNKLYEFENAAGSETAKLYVGDFISDDPDANQKPHMLKVVVANAESEGTLTVTPFVDRKKQNNAIQNRPITAVRDPDAIPLTIPFGDSANTNAQVLAFNMGRIEQGWKIGFQLELDCQADIVAVSMSADDETQQAGLKATVGEWARMNGVNP